MNQENEYALDVIAAAAANLRTLPKAMYDITEGDSAVRLLDGLAVLHHQIHVECLRILSEREGKPKPQERGRLERLQNGGNGGNHEG